MFVSFTKTLKKMSGFRLGFGVRVNKRNAPLWCFAMLFAANVLFDVVYDYRRGLVSVLLLVGVLQDLLLSIQGNCGRL